jgi:hypothetical protein
MKMMVGFVVGLMAVSVLSAQETGAKARAEGPAMSASAGQEQDETAGTRPMTFIDLQRMKRLSDPQISTSSTWVMFSSVDVDLAANTKTSHLWVVPLAGGREKQLTFWKEGETNGRFSPDGKHVLFVSTRTGMRPKERWALREG